MNFFPTTGLQSGVGTAFPSSASFPHYAIQQGIPYNVYGYALYGSLFMDSCTNVCHPYMHLRFKVGTCMQEYYRYIIHACT